MGERALEGVSAAPGVAIGPAILLDHDIDAPPGLIPQARRGVEAARARAALETAAAELDAIVLRLREEGRSSEADIVETGVLMAGDPGLIQQMEALVGSGLSATEALRKSTEAMAATLESLPDPLLAQRGDDVRSVGRRAAARAAGIVERAGQGVLIARSLGPADVAEFATSAIGIALAGGGVTSHAAIVARSLGLPMVIGLGADLLHAEDGEEVVIDGDHGVLVRMASRERAASARSRAEKARADRELSIARSAEPALTRDRRRVRVLANASTVAELQEAMRQGAEGVGLMRTELLFLEALSWPTFEQQVRVMRPVLTGLAGQVATVRLFDFGGDKTPPFLRGITTRGIDVLLEAPSALHTHMKAVQEAGGGTRLRILVPMVTTAAQVRSVRELALDGVEVGAMIETPEAAERAAEIARESDFISIGTNDLTQLVLGLDREQSRRAPVMDARVLSLVARTMQAARGASIPVDVCGEAASDPIAMRAMVGFGADELSVAAARVGQVREWVRGLEYGACKKEAEQLLQESGNASRQRV